MFQLLQLNFGKKIFFGMELKSKLDLLNHFSPNLRLNEDEAFVSSSVGFVSYKEEEKRNNRKRLHPITGNCKL